jgi:hypothetical protein
MRYLLPKIWLATAAVFTAGAANANEELIKMVSCADTKADLW